MNIFNFSEIKMNPILVPCFEVDEFINQVSVIAKKLYEVEYIKLFIKNNGTPLFEDYEYQPIECKYCLIDNDFCHTCHIDLYSQDVLNSVLVGNWQQEIYNVYFPQKGANYV